MAKAYVNGVGWIEKETNAITVSKNNDTYVILPSQGKLLSKVTVNVDIPEQEKTLDVTKDGTYNITPDQGKMLSGVTVNVDTPDTKAETSLNVEITENGAQVHTPAEGTVFNRVSFNVNVPQGEGGTDNSVLTSLIDRSITEIEIPVGVTKVGTGAFYRASIEEVIVPEGVKKIEEFAFGNCTSLKRITLPNTLTSISNDAFPYVGQASGMDEFIIPDSVISIGYNVFLGSGAKKFVVSKNLKRILEGTFKNCQKCMAYDFTGNENVPVLQNVLAFGNIPADCKIYVPKSLYDQWIVATNWAEYADYIVGVRGEGDPSEGLDMYLSWDGTRYSLNGIGTCTDTEIVIPNEYNGLPVTDIVDGFSDNKDITKVVFGSNINYIEYWTFDGCSNCKTYDFSRVTQIPYCGSNSFGGSSEDDPFYSVYPFDNPEDLPEGTRFIVPASLYDAWKTETNWCLYADYIVAAE